jgi:hypothetical protein
LTFYRVVDGLTIGMILFEKLLLKAPLRLKSFVGAKCSILKIL